MEEKGSYDAVVGEKTFCITKDMISKVRGVRLSWKQLSTLPTYMGCVDLDLR